MKRVGNSVTRNRLKRLIREWFRTHKEELASVAVIVQAKPAAAELGFDELADSLNRLILTAVAR